jgi:spermidine synthase
LRPTILFAAIYTCSGVSGLIYEVVWTRLFTLHTGHTVAAAGTVLAAFMGGLAAGAFVAGPIAARLDPPRALRGYALSELAVASAALVLPLALGALQPLLAWAYGDEPGVTFAVARVVTCFTLVFVPAAAMGATFPLAIRWAAGEGAAGGRRAAHLYAFNTLGAALGALATGFILIPLLGLRGTTAIGVALNVAAAAGAWLIAGRSGALPAESEAPKQRSARRPVQMRRKASPALPQATVRWLAPALLGLSGFTALLYEVVFTRVLASALGPTSYAFAAMLAAFIGGLAIGAALASWRRWTVAGAAFAAGLILLGSALAAGAAAGFSANRLPLLVAAAVADPSMGAVEILAREALFAAGVLMPLSCLFGALFPLGVVMATAREGSVPRDVSLLYGANTIGAVAGSLAAAFAIVPLLGVQPALKAGAMLAVVGGCLAFLAAPLPPWQRFSGLALAVVTALSALTTAGWDPNLLSSGAYKYAGDVRALNLDLDLGLKAGRLLYFREGAAATVSVRELAGIRALAIDGKVDASNGTDMLTQKLLAHLPLLLHRDPDEICIIGLGSGVTLGAALRHGIERADVIEISPEVVQASAFFADENAHALEDRRVKLLIADGRSHLRLTSRRYDVIISEPSNPWMAGVASLFTREFFLAARARLAEGGIICQWAHTYDMSDDDLRSIAATFASVFPNGTIWLVGEGDLLLIASNDEDGPVLDNIAPGWQRDGVSADLARVSVLDVFSLLSSYVGGPNELRRYADRALVQTDDRSRLEFSGPLGIYDQRSNENRKALEALLGSSGGPALVQSALASAGANEWRNRGQMLLRAHDYQSAYESFSRSLRANADDEAALAGLFDAAGAGGRVEDAARLLESLATAQPGSSAVRLAWGRLLAASGATDQAAARAREAMAIDSMNPRAAELLASILADTGDAGRLRPLVGRMQQTHPDRDETWYYAAMLSFLDGELPQAIQRAERAVAINPHHALAHGLIGSAAASLGQRDRARQAFRAALAEDPEDPAPYAQLGRLELEAGNRDAALAYFVESLTLNPTEGSAREGLSALRASGPPLR